MDDEAALIRRFWNTLQPDDLLVGHNILDFDLPFLQQRSWILGIKPSRPIDLRRYYTKQVVDTLESWTNSGSKKGGSLENLCRALGLGGKTALATEVAAWWNERNLARLKNIACKMSG